MTTDSGSSQPDSLYPSTFSEQLVRHCEASFIPPQVFSDIAERASSFPRYVRLHPKLASEWESANCDKTFFSEKLARTLGIDSSVVSAVDWLPCHCFALPRGVPMSGGALFEQGLVCAMDASSMAAVIALGVRAGDAVLDLCCSPGMKLNMLADAVGRSDGFVMGVDVSVPRLFIARAQVVKHNKPHARLGPSDPRICLIAADGRTVDTAAVRSGAFDTHANATLDPRSGLTAVEDRRLQKTNKKRQRSDKGEAVPPEAANPAPQAVFAPSVVRPVILDESQWDGLFDRVLVDAECSHDGSLAHINLKAHAGGAKPPADYAGITNEHRMSRMNVGLASEAQAAAAPPVSDDSPPDAALAELQLGLLMNGYRQLRPGGTLVYSTCSFSFWQNEYIVLRFMERAATGDNHSVPLVVPPFSEDTPFTTPDTASTAAVLAALQGRLDACQDPYGIIKTGSDRIGAKEPLHIGSRFWPCEFATSFQYVAKIVKCQKQSDNGAE